MKKKIYYFFRIDLNKNLNILVLEKKKKINSNKITVNGFLKVVICFIRVNNINLMNTLNDINPKENK